MTAICYVGADFFAKANLLILIALVVAIVFVMASLIFQQQNAIEGYTGFSWKTFLGNLPTDFGTTDPTHAATWTPRGTFGILFPACTGIMAGVNMYFIYRN